MAHVILGHCCKDASCVRVCPQNCIHPAPGEDGFASTETLYIDPDSCIDCTACVEACPASAIKSEHALTSTELPYAARNREYFAQAPAAPRPRAVFELPLPGPRDRLEIAIVGSGAAAMYTVRELLQRSSSIRVTVYEQYDTVGGLLRRGVSPDHVGVREMIRLFDVPFGDDRVTVVPETEVGVDISMSELRARFDAVILASGASQPRRIGSSGVGDGIHQAIDILVAENSGASLPTAPAGPGCVVVGAGNVAFDVVRWVARTRDRTPVGEQLRELVILSRSAPEAAAFTPSAFYELLGLADTEVLLDRAGSMPRADVGSPLLRALSNLPSTGVGGVRALPTGAVGPLRVVLSFGQEVAELAKTELGAVAVTTTAGRTFLANSAICATGFTTAPIDGVPVGTRGVVPNRRGQVISHETGEPLDGLYVVGWAKRGASGGVGDNRGCAAETVTQLAADLHSRV